MTEYYIYKTIKNDRWDLIASKFYGNQYDFADIINANPHVSIQPVLDENIELRIPIRENTADNKINLPIWKQN